MKFYTITKDNGALKNGYNEAPFNPSAEWFEVGGIPFYQKDVLAFLNHGTELFEVEPVGHIYADDSAHPRLYRTGAAHLKYKGKVRDKIEFLLKEGANIHAGKDGALIWAIEKRDVELVKLLVKHGANVNARQYKPLMLASDYHLVEAIKILIKAGANPNKWSGWPLKKAIYDKDFKLIEFLIAHGADVNIDHGWALWHALKEKNFKLAKLLVKYGADVKVSLSNFIN